MEIYGRGGTLIVSSEGSANTSAVRIQGAKGGNTLADLEVPGKYKFVLEGMPEGEPAVAAAAKDADRRARNTAPIHRVLGGRGYAFG